MSESTSLVDVAALLKKELAAVKETVEAPSSNKINTKGKVFSLPDGTTGPGPIMGIILDYIAANKYYPGVYNQNKPEPPSCWAFGRNIKLLAPGPTVKKAEHTDCENCPRNQWKSGAGGKGKACKNQRRLLILAVPKEGEPFGEPMTLEVSPTGLKGWNKYVDKDLSSNMGVLPIQVVTEIAFDPNQAYPTLTFKYLEKHARVAEALQIRENYQDMLFKEPEIKAA